MTDDDEQVLASGSIENGRISIIEDAPSTSAPAPEYELPCSINGLMSGFSGGMLGFVFGAGGQLIKHRGAGRLRAAGREGFASAKTFAVMGGVYAAVQCFMKRLRLKEDAFNGAAAGCATGLVLGWSGGPASALQSCAGLGLFSFVVDFMSLRSAAHAAELQCSQQVRSGKPAVCSKRVRRRPGGAAGGLARLAADSPLGALLTPAACWLQPLCPACPR